MSVQQKENRVYLTGELTPELAERACMALTMASLQSQGIVELHISSPGGQMNAAHRILDAIQTCSKPIYAYIHMLVASAASMIVSYCSRRTIYRGATFMIHHASRQGQIVENEDDILFWMERTGMPYELIQEFIVSERLLSAEEALVFGFVDEVR